MAEKNKFWLAAAILWLSITPPCVSYAWNEPDSFMGLKFWRPIGEGSMPDCESIRPPLVMRPKPSVNPAERSRPSASKAENELTKSRNSTLDNLQSRDDILNRLLVQHEAERTERLNEYENRRNLYYQGKISRAEVTEAEEALAGAILRVDEDKRLLADADSTVANIIGAREPCWEKLGNDGASHRVKNVAIGGFFFDINAESLEGKLAHLFIVFFQADYGTILLTFKERYGAPTSIKTETVQNGLGAKFQNEIVKWEGKRLTITVDKLGFGINKGTINYDTDIWKKHSARKFQEDIKKAAKKL